MWKLSYFFYLHKASNVDSKCAVGRKMAGGTPAVLFTRGAAPLPRLLIATIGLVRTDAWQDSTHSLSELPFYITTVIPSSGQRLISSNGKTKWIFFFADKKIFSKCFDFENINIKFLDLKNYIFGILHFLHVFLCIVLWNFCCCCWFYVFFLSLSHIWIFFDISNFF